MTSPTGFLRSDFEASFSPRTVWPVWGIKELQFLSLPELLQEMGMLALWGEWAEKNTWPKSGASYLAASSQLCQESHLPD